MDIRAISVPEISLLRSLSRRQWFLLEREKNWLLRRRAKHYREAALLIFHAGHYVDLMVRKQNWRFLFFSNNKTMSITMLHHDAHCTLFTKMWKCSIRKKEGPLEGHFYMGKMLNLRERVSEEALLVTKSVTFFRQFLLEIDIAWTGTTVEEDRLLWRRKMQMNVQRQQQNKDLVCLCFMVVKTVQLSRVSMEPSSDAWTMDVAVVAMRWGKLYHKRHFDFFASEYFFCIFKSYLEHIATLFEFYIKFLCCFHEKLNRTSHQRINLSSLCSLNEWQ